VEYKLGRSYSTHERKEGKGRDHSEVLGVDGRILESSFISDNNSASPPRGTGAYFPRCKAAGA